jgi:exosortase A-associated hydrolase 1
MTHPPPQERALTFACGDATLVGIVHVPPVAVRRGVLIVVGGPQYRAGSHRQFLLLARSLADCGVPVLRFDHRGIGDSDGPYCGFEALDDDIAAAIDAFLAACPQLEEVVLWGLCDAASAILFYAHRDPRVAGLVLANPWVRTPESEARVYLRHYYLRRLAQGDFWSGILAGRVNPFASAGSLLRLLGRRLGKEPKGGAPAALPDRMAEGLARFQGPALLIMSGQDLTAREFEDAAREGALWRRLLAEERITREDLAPADHTFSRRAWRDTVGRWTLDWLHSW